MARPMYGTPTSPDNSNPASSTQQYNVFSSMAMDARPWVQFAEVSWQVLRGDVVCSTWHPQECTYNQESTKGEQEVWRQENEISRTLSKTSWTARQQNGAMRTNTWHWKVLMSWRGIWRSRVNGCEVEGSPEDAFEPADHSQRRTCNRSAKPFCCGSHAGLSFAL